MHLKCECGHELRCSHCHAAIITSPLDIFDESKADSVEKWVDACCAKESASRQQLGYMYNGYKNFCNKRSIPLIGKINFRRRLQEIGFVCEVGNSNVMMVHGMFCHNWNGDKREE